MEGLPPREQQLGESAAVEGFDLEAPSASNQSNDSVSSQKVKWIWCGRSVPKSEIVYFTQMIILYIVICTSLVMLAMKNEDGHLWAGMLGSCLGYILPNPKIKTNKNKSE